MGEVIGLGIVLLIWVISSLIKGFKLLLRRTGAVQAPPPSQAPPRSQVPFQQALSQPLGQGQFGNQPPLRSQAPPPSQRPAVRVQPVQRERQPAAGGPAVPTETNRSDFERQEQELFASEPSAIDTPLTSLPARNAPAPNRLFGGTDDLVRAIILQEVLGPPLSRRAAPASSLAVSSPESPQ